MKRISRFKLLAFALLALTSHALAAQDTAWARQCIKTYSSPAFHGRGYSLVPNTKRSGASLCASAIADSFAKWQPKARVQRDSFMQTINVLWAPSETMSISFQRVDTSTLKPITPMAKKPEWCGVVNVGYILGYHFNPDPACPSIKGRFELHSWPVKKKDCKDSFLLIINKVESKSVFASPAFSEIKALPKFKGVVLNDSNKLIHSYATEQLPFALFHADMTGRPELSQTSTFNKPTPIGYIDLKATLAPQPVINVFARIKGRSSDSILIVCAHYDHLGGLSDMAYFPGANDNASGIALLMDLYRSYASKSIDMPAYDTYFIAFGGEESGLLGSSYFVESHPDMVKSTAFVFNLDLLGNGASGATVVNASEWPQHFAKLNIINTKYNCLAKINSRGTAANSDHYPFHIKGVKSFFMYLTDTYPDYHNVYDTWEKPNLLGYKGAFNLVRYFLQEYNSK